LPDEYDTIPLARPAIDDADLLAVDRSLRSGRLTRGPENERFEAAIAAAAGRKHAVCVGSGTAALELSLTALEIGFGDRVLVSAFGFPAVVNALLARGAVVVPVDVERGPWTLSLEDAHAASGPGARALVSIDQLGAVCEQRATGECAAALGLEWINDAACGLGGADSEGLPGGSGGTMATFSFHPRKIITTGEGGAVVTDRGDIYSSLRALRNHGQAEAGRFERIGTNARLAEPAAALGASQISRLSSAIAERRLLAQGYRQRLASLCESGRLFTQEVAPTATHSYQTFAVVLEDAMSRDDVCKKLREHGIEAGPATYAFPAIDEFAQRVERRPTPVADMLHHQALALPLYLGMRSAELDRVSEALEEALA
jgi:dTDP-4-amino-4,6-dideoxygalactose transaminase